MIDQQPEQGSTIELIHQYTSMVRHWGWLFILAAILAGAIGYIIARNQTSIYQASTVVAVNGATNSLTDTYNGLYVGLQLIPTYAREMTMRSLLDAVAQRLGLETFPGNVRITPITGTQLMSVVVTDTNPERAANLANTLVSVFADQLQAEQASRYADSKKNLESQIAIINQQVQDNVAKTTTLDQQILDANNSLSSINQEIQKTTDNPGTVDAGTAAAELTTRDKLQSGLIQFQVEKAQLQTTLGQYQQSLNILLQSYENLKLAESQSSSSIIQKDIAIPDKSPIRPRPVRSAFLAGMAGLIIAVATIFLIDFLEDTIRNPEEITLNWGIPVLGIIGNYGIGKGKNYLITSNEPRSPVSEAFRSLRTNIQFASVATPLHTLVFTSASPKDGKTVTASNFGSVLAQSGQSVLIMDADMRRPRIHEMFQLTNRFGLADQFIHPQDQLDGTVKPTDIKDLHVLTSGSLPPNPSELLGSERMLEILRQMSSQYKTVILDSPPILVVTDALVLAPRVDGVVLVFKPSNTKRAALKYAIGQLNQAKANLLGVVVNDVKIDRGSYYFRNNVKGYYYNEKKMDLVIEPKVEKPTDRTESSLNLKDMTNTPGKKSILAHFFPRRVR